jgi:hypothetical protein
MRKCYHFKFDTGISVGFVPLVSFVLAGREVAGNDADGLKDGGKSRYRER